MHCNSYHSVFLFFLFTILSIKAQKAGGFYDKLHEFNFPSSPVPAGAIFYKINHNLKTGTINMKDYRGEVVTIDNFNHKRPSYTPDYNNYKNPLSILKEYDDERSTKTNTVFYNLNSSNIELYYKKGENDSIYDVYANFSAQFTAKFNGKTIAKDSLLFKDKVGEIVSKLRNNDFAIVAVNKSKGSAYTANDLILVELSKAFVGFVRRAEMSYRNNNIPFFKLRKTKKLVSSEVITTLTNNIRNLHTNDNGIKSRNDRNKEIERLLNTLISLVNSEDYKAHDAYKLFVHGNLGSLYTLLEQYKKGMTEYDLGINFATKVGVKSYLLAGKQNAEFSMIRKEKLFLPGENKIRPEYSENYTKRYLGDQL